jgi:MFS family permease
MKTLMKAGIVFAGYALALIASVVSVMVYDRHFTAADNQTMGGMIAGGEMMYGIAIFLLVALAPTLLALWFLRRSRVVWSAFTLLGLAFAIFGLAAVLTPPLLGPAGSHDPWIALFSLFSVGQMLGSPLWIAAFGLFAWLAPERHFRRRMLAASAIEIAVAVVALVHFVLPRPPS